MKQRIGALGGTVWEFYAGPSLLLCPYLQLLANGFIGNYRHPNEHSWTITDDRLVFWDDNQIRSSTFDKVETDRDDLLRFTGTFRDGTIVSLKQARPCEQLARPTDAVRLVSNKAPTGRRNLVVLRADRLSLHTRWVRDIAEHDRSWDLCISFYGKAEHFETDAYAEYQVLQNEGYKYDSLYALMYEGCPFWQYDYVAFPDDDLMMRWSELNTMFAVCRSHDLDLAQPSLLPDGFNHFKELEQNRSYILRYVSMVETIMPIFSRKALSLCVPTFALNRFGIGTDFVWARLVGTPFTKVAVIDKVGVTHTRPIGRSYDALVEAEKGSEISARFNLHGHFRVETYGGIFAKPTLVSQWSDFIKLVRDLPI